MIQISMALKYKDVLAGFSHYATVLLLPQLNLLSAADLVKHMGASSFRVPVTLLAYRRLRGKCRIV
jgi:hypothetical protein